MIIGICMMYYSQVISSPPFMSGLALFTIGLYLGLQGRFGSRFSGCIFNVPKKKPEPKKKGLFGF